MPYITREDGERFVIPSYRDVISAKNNSALKNEIITLSQSYGEYITLQRKSATAYDLAFSPDTGYLLGESIWHYFNRPLDMIYCEAVPNTTEAILVIVKDGGVYLDGRFPMESIPEELIIFLTQKNNFEISIFGDVPLAEVPSEGKFSFDANSVKSFTVLKEPVFPTLPLLKNYQFQLVEPTLKRYGIGGFPVKPVVTLLVFAGLAWMAWSYFAGGQKAAPTSAQPEANPYQGFYDAFRSPAPDAEVKALVSVLNDIITIPGWTLMKVNYSHGTAICDMQSQGAGVQALMGWAAAHQGTVNVVATGVQLVMPIQTTLRTMPKQIYPVKESLAVLLDRLVKVYPGNHFQMAQVSAQGVYTSISTSILITNATLSQLDIIGQQLNDLPFIVSSISLDYLGTQFNGSFTLQLLGS